MNEIDLEKSIALTKSQFAYFKTKLFATNHIRSISLRKNS